MTLRRGPAQLQQGIMQGIEQGRMQEKAEAGRRAREEKRAMARAMKAEGIDTALITKVTGLAAEEIEG